MTKKPSSKGWEAAQRIRAERIAAATAAFGKLFPGEQVAVLLRVFDEATVARQQQGLKPRAPGAYEAAVVAVSAFLEGELMEVGSSFPEQDARNREHNSMAARLAAVGRGVAVRSMTSDASTEIREVSEFVGAVLESTIDSSTWADVIAVSLSKRFRPPPAAPLTREAVAAALRLRHPRRITEIAIALQLVPMPAEAGTGGGRKERAESVLQRKKAWKRADDLVRFALGLKEKRGGVLDSTATKAKPGQKQPSGANKRQRRT